jgi:hypothetical protein
MSDYNYYISTDAYVTYSNPDMELSEFSIGSWTGPPQCSLADLTKPDPYVRS